MKAEKLPRGIRRRGDSLIVTFALKDGTIERRSVGPVSAKFAVGQREIYKRQVAEGTYVKAQPRPKETPAAPEFTLTDLWNEYLRDYMNRSGKDTGRIEIGWNHLKPLFAAVSISKITTAMVNEYIESRRAMGIQNATINRETSLLQAMLHFGTRLTPPIVDHMPAFPRKLKENPPRKGFVIDKDYAKLKTNCTVLWLRALIAAAYAFGFRKGEMLNLRVRQIDFLDRWIELEVGTTKNGEARKARMTTEVYDLLRECVRGKGPDDFVFTRDEERDDGTVVRTRVVDPRDDWYALCVKAGLGQLVPAKRKNGQDYLKYVGLNLHDFRRSAIRNMTRRGVGNKTAMSISGHKTFAVFQRYNIVDETDLIEASEKIENGSRKVRVETDTKTDTSSFERSVQSRNSLI